MLTLSELFVELALEIDLATTYLDFGLLVSKINKKNFLFNFANRFLTAK